MQRRVASKVWYIAAALLAALTIPLLPGQIQTGRIVGTVYDPNKAVVPNAAVTVTNRDTKQEQRVSTNGTGNYVVPALNPGLYDIKVSAPGFRTIAQSAIEMQVGKDLLLDFDLVLGETSSLIEVTSSVPLLNSESGSLGHVMTNN